MAQKKIQNRRLELDDIFRGLTPNVYFQPPESTKMKFPAIRYKRTAFDTTYADNSPYLIEKAYEVTVIDKNPDSEIVDAISKLKYARHIRFFTNDNLNHDVFLIYF
jgi:hypothetical protein